MTVWFVIPANKEAAFKAVYLAKKIRGKDNPNEDEKAVLVPNADGSKLMTGSSRVTLVQADELRQGNPPWLEVYDHWPPTQAEGGWEYKK